MRRLARDRRGVAALEFVLLGSGVVLLVLGFADVVQFARAHLRVQNAATQIGQIVSQCARVSGGDNGDEGELKKLAGSILGSAARAGEWTLVITAIGRDAEDKAFTWNTLPANPPQVVKDNSKGSQLPAGLALSRDEVVFRTEVFARPSMTLLPRVGDAFGSALHMTRTPNAGGLKTKVNGAAECLKEAN
jgi:hypothetical protein